MRPAKGDSRRKFSRNIQTGSTSAMMHRWRFAETELISTHISARIRTAPLHHSRRHDLRECPFGNIYFLEINPISPSRSQQVRGLPVPAAVPDVADAARNFPKSPSALKSPVKMLRRGNSGAGFRMLPG
jgi:hypothetical protein